MQTTAEKNFSVDKSYLIIRIMCWKVLKLCKKDAENLAD